MQQGPEITEATINTTNSEPTEITQESPVQSELTQTACSPPQEVNSKELTELLEKFKKLGVSFKTTVTVKGWTGSYEKERPLTEQYNDAQKLIGELKEIAKENEAIIPLKSPDEVAIREGCSLGSDNKAKGVVKTLLESEKAGKYSYQHNKFGQELLAGYKRVQQLAVESASLEKEALLDRTREIRTPSSEKEKRAGL